LLDELNLSTSPWCLLKDKNQWNDLFQTVGEKIVVKRRTGGYDGRGQWIISDENKADITDDLFGEVIAEKFIPFDYEVSIVGARFKNGEKRFYPVTHNLQQNGILRYSVVDIAFSQQSAQQKQAEAMLGKIMDKLSYVGIMAMECFVVGDKLLINELKAPGWGAKDVDSFRQRRQIECHMTCCISTNGTDKPSIKVIYTHVSTLFQTADFSIMERERRCCSLFTSLFTRQIIDTCRHIPLYKAIL